MAVFVFGAGATRGCSFVDPAKDAIQPPLDADFFTQIQRVAKDKHQDLIRRVLEDTIRLFGQNFHVSLETVFTTLEHTIRMVEATKERRGFEKKELARARDDLVQAIAVSLEESLTMPGQSRQPRPCAHHSRFVREVLRPMDKILSFNYDCVLDYSLKSDGDGKWNPRYGYGFNLGSGGSRLRGDKPWAPGNPATKERTAHLYKLHGSLHFRTDIKGGKKTMTLKQRPYTRQSGNLVFDIIPPVWHKQFDEGFFKRFWEFAAEALHKTRQLVLIGYSMPTSDLHSSALFRTALAPEKLNSLVIVNPDSVARRRTREILHRALMKETRILSLDRLEHFLALDQNSWRR